MDNIHIKMKNNSGYLKQHLMIFISICSIFCAQGSYFTTTELDGITYGEVPGGWDVIEISDKILRSGEIIIPEVIRDGDSIVGLAPNLFAGIRYVKTVKLPSGITTIPNGCFLNCNNLERIESQKIARLNKECLKNCTSLKFINGEEIVKNNALDIPQSLTYIGSNVFEGWDVEHLRINPSDNDSELELDWHAFAEMNKLRTAEFSRNCYYKCKSGDLGFCFSGNPDLEEIRFTKNYIDSDDWYTYSYTYKPTTKKEPDLTLKKAIQYYDQLSTRTNLPALKKVIVENECFEPIAMDYGEAHLIVSSEKFLLPDRYDVVLTNTLTSVYEGEIYEFEYWDYNLDQAVYWEYGALYSVSKLTIGKDVKEICIDKFDNLNEITVLIPEPPTWGTEFQKNVYLDAILRVPEQYVESYKNASGWKNFNIKPFDASAGVEEIGNEAYAGEPEYFDLTGRKVIAPEKGIYILKDSRGARKVVL